MPMPVLAAKLFVRQDHGALVLITGSLIFGSTHEISRTVLMGAAWMFNLSVAELVIRRRRTTTPIS